LASSLDHIIILLSLDASLVCYDAFKEYYTTKCGLPLEFESVQEMEMIMKDKLRGEQHCVLSCSVSVVSLLSFVDS
jgi:hypothetical protein